MINFANLNNITYLTDPSGILYETILSGSGGYPQITSNITVNYVGKLMNGTTFDSGTNITLPLAALIQGWQIGVPLIQIGGRIKLIIPSSLAYGCDGAGAIPPNAPLYFDITLVTATNIIIITPTPTPTVTETPTFTPTVTPTVTPTITNTPTITYSPPVATDPTLEIWYDYSDNSTISLNGNEIVSVNDKSTGTVKPSNSTGSKRPKQVTNYQNGLNVSYFDGDNDLFTINPITNFQSLTGNTMIIVGKFNNPSATNTMVQLGSGGNQRNASWLSINGGNYKLGMGQGLATTSGVTVDTGFHIFTCVFDGSQTGNNNRMKFRIDGSEKVLTFSQNVSGTTSSDTNVFYIGETASATEDLDGYIGEILLYTKSLSFTEMVNTENYLHNKWGIPKPPSVTFSQTFTQGVAPGTAIENAWTTFRSQLSGTYTSFDFYSSNGQGIYGVTDPIKVQQLASALYTGTTGTDFSTVINGVTWIVKHGCRAGIIVPESIEFANVAACSGSSTASLRPFINNSNWGGIGSTVGAATQTLTLKFY
jgi:hypothetical protein